MATAPIYCTHKELKRIYPQIDAFDTKTPIYGWVHTGGDKYVSYNSGIVTQLFRDGQDLGAAQSAHGDVDADYEWALIVPMMQFMYMILLVALLIYLWKQVKSSQQ